MSDLAIERDREESLPDQLRATHEVNAITPPDFALDDVGCGEQAEPALAELADQRDVVELSATMEGRIDCCAKPLLERAPERRIGARQQHRGALE